jgi:4a-hydroxytetrahydrobiopterin dehydratase
MAELAEKKCQRCDDGVPPLSAEEINPLLEQVSGWEVVENHHLRKQFKFPDFSQALDFVNRVGAVAEAEDHHPDIFLSWGRAEIKIWTHKVNGLTENDFILAAKIDRVRT